MGDGGEDAQRARIEARRALFEYAIGARDGRGLSAVDWLGDIEQGPAWIYARELSTREIEAIVSLVWIGRIKPKHY